MTERLTNEALIEKLRKRADQIGKLLSDPPKDAPDAVLMREAADALAHRRASQAAPAPSDGLREALEECDCCVDGLKADGETPCPYCTKPRVPVVDAAEALLEAHKSGAWPVGQGRTLQQVATIIDALHELSASPAQGGGPLDVTTRVVLDRAERIVAGQSQQERRIAEIFLRPTENSHD